MNILIDGQTLESPEINRGIGVYFKNVLNNMVKQTFSDEWYITVSDKNSLRHLDPWVAERITPIPNPVFAPGTDYERTSAYTEALSDAAAQYCIDVYWNPNPFMVNVLFPNRWLGCAMFITVHDVIPAVMPVKEWSSVVREEYFRRLDGLKGWEQIGLICVSKASEKDAKRFCGETLKTFVTLEAADSRKFYTCRRTPGIRKEPVLVFTGGFDYRKNMDGAIEAYADACQMAPKEHPIKRSRLFIVCQVSEDMKKVFYEKTERLGIGKQVTLTGYLSDLELKKLYAACDLFFFPSLYEGFGLPILEAMLGGAYILSADNSSLPEVCGGHALLCCARNLEDMAQKLITALDHAASESVQEKNARQNYALSFSWEKTAAETLETFRDTGFSKTTKDKAVNPQAAGTKKRLAFVTPWPEQKTGIANHVYELLPHLAETFDIDVFADNTIKSDGCFAKNPVGNLYMIHELDSLQANYDEIIFEMGNSAEYHSGVYEAMLKYKGIAEIHDFVLHPFFYWAYFLKKKHHIYRDALEAGYGKEGLLHYKQVKEKSCYPDNEKFPMCDSVLQRAEAAIFHNHWSKKQFGQKENIYVVPLPCFNKHAVSGNKASLEKTVLDKINGKEKGQTVIGCFGYVNENKRPYRVIEVVARLINEGFDVKLVFWGNSNIDNFKDQIPKYLKERIYVSGYLSRDEYICALELTDLVVNLRYPSMGEASATLCEAFEYGKAVIVSDVNQYREFPDEICWKVPVAQGEQECLTAMLQYLIENKSVRKVLGENARNYAKNILAPEKIAHQYRQIFSEIMYKKGSL